MSKNRLTSFKSKVKQDRLSRDSHTSPLVLAEELQHEAFPFDTPNQARWIYLDRDVSGDRLLGTQVRLLLPAVQRERETANCLRCQNNLKQLGLAFQLHHDQMDYFPPGGWYAYSPPTYIHAQPGIGA